MKPVIKLTTEKEHNNPRIVALTKERSNERGQGLPPGSLIVDDIPSRSEDKVICRACSKVYPYTEKQCPRCDTPQ